MYRGNWRIQADVFGARAARCAPLEGGPERAAAAGDRGRLTLPHCSEQVRAGVTAATFGGIVTINEPPLGQNNLG